LGRIEKMRLFTAPDESTARRARKHAIDWLEDRNTFWKEANAQQQGLDPQAFAVGAYYRHDAAPGDDD
jgi:hypothetical protein